MQFSTELLSILVLVSLALAGTTFLAVLILCIIYLYSLYSKRRQCKTVKPIPTHSTGSSVSIRDHSPPLTPIPNKTSAQHNKFDGHYHGNHMMDEHSYLNINKNKYQQQEYMRDDSDETTTTLNESQMYDQRQKKRSNQSVKPAQDIRILERHTPYPPDVIARERLMNNNRFSMNNKY